MTQKELTERNVGQNLDDIMCMDPRGYGVCRILYVGARAYAGEPVSVKFAKELQNAVNEGGVVYIITGFVLPPHRHAETDGIIGATLFARALAVGLGARPVLIVPEECVDAAFKIAPAVGLHAYGTIEEAVKYPYSMGVLQFPRDMDKADARADEILAMARPAAILATEAAAANYLGVYHNALGVDVTDMEAKTDVLFKAAQKAGIPTFAIGDLGNEIGMGAIAGHIEMWIPRASKNLKEQCILADTAADTILTATVSDWGMNAVIAALAFLKGNLDILHSDEMQKDAIVAASRAGMVNMYGDLNPAIDGFDVDLNVTILHMMRRLIEYALKLRETCKPWFDIILKEQSYLGTVPL